MNRPSRFEAGSLLLAIVAVQFSGCGDDGNLKAGVPANTTGSNVPPEVAAQAKDMTKAKPKPSSNIPK